MEEGFFFVNLDTLKLQKILFIIFLGVWIKPAFSTHNRAGEIIYCQIGNSLKYGITIITYTKASSCAADRCELEIQYGDGSRDTISRINGSPCQGGCGSCGKCGDLIGNDTKKNIYYTEHTYSGIGTYKISMEDPTRNSDIMNVPSSVDVPFYIESELIISPGIGSNCSPALQNPPIDNGCVGLPYLHNPGAYDPDGDSLSFKIIDCRGSNGDPILGYVQPELTAGCTHGTLSIDARTGLVSWNYPICQGEYNLAILIEEYRNGYKIGSVVRDMQITIISPCPNKPPVIKPMEPICALAGDTIEKMIRATDPDTGDLITLSGSGEPLNLAISNAVFSTEAMQDSVKSLFYWKTQCEHVRNASYLMNFKAVDNNPIIPLVDYKSLEIKVIAPKVENMSIDAIGNNIYVDWNTASCSNASCYNIYRRIDSSGYVPGPCETGVPVSTGYQLIQNITGLQNSQFTDQDPSLVHGQKYCYLVTSCFSTNTESQASREICTELKRDVPIITHVTITETDITQGKDTLRWSKPTQLDTLLFAGPYQYKIYRGEGLTGATSLIHTTPLASSISLLDSVYADNLLNTSDQAYHYKIELYYNTNILVGSSDAASSVYLSSTPTDNILNLSWQFSVPWVNYKYVVHKRNELGVFEAVDTVNAPTYQDTGLINKKEYCYYITTIGKYSIADLEDTLLNKSQIHCNSPQDNVAPCAPQLLNVEKNCDQISSEVIWNNPNNRCADDVVRYYIYYTPQLGKPYELMDSIVQSLDTNYLDVDTFSLAGCYKITAIDTFYNQSVFSDSMCVDNCPVYTLPNVFSPGKDGYNDFFRPFPYKYIQSIDLSIYNRWGEKVFKTTDPKINWDGRHQKSGKLCTAGTYYYLCDVYAVRLNGIEKFSLKGFLEMFPEAVYYKSK